MIPADFITANALVAHAVGDYLLQSDWMALNKTKSHWPALAHVVAYTLPFVLLTQSVLALLFIAVTHFVIDRWRLARYVVWAKNHLAPREVRDNHTTDHEVLRHYYAWKDCDGTGYHAGRPPFLAVWLLIIADNTLHVILNGIALSGLFR
jgi:hypothetical protein